MDAFPELDIYFPLENEDLLIAAMRERANATWESRAESPVGREVQDGQYFFHRNGETPCTVCLCRQTPGHLYVTNLTPDENGSVHEQRTEIISDFDSQIAAPAAEAVDGYTSIGTDTNTLEDYLDSATLCSFFVVSRFVVIRSRVAIRCRGGRI